MEIGTLLHMRNDHTQIRLRMRLIALDFAYFAYTITWSFSMNTKNCVAEQAGMGLHYSILSYYKLEFNLFY